MSLALGEPTNVVKQISLPTSKVPAETLAEVAKTLADWDVDLVGIASFGPVELNRSSPRYGFITSTPKLAWQNTDVVGGIRRGLEAAGKRGVTIGFTTDVNAAALAELRFGGHGQLNSCVYATVGTGVGLGVVVNGHVVEGLLHPEGGHVRVVRHPEDTYKGNCPYHADCLEGMSNAIACAEKAGVPQAELANVPDSHPLWEWEAFYLAQLCVTATMFLSPEVIVLGGGVLHRTSLFPRVRAETLRLLNGYIQADKIVNHIDSYIVPSRFNAPGSGTTCGAVGALYVGLVEQQRAALAAAAAAAPAAASAGAAGAGAGAATGVAAGGSCGSRAKGGHDVATMTVAMEEDDAAAPTPAAQSSAKGKTAFEKLQSDIFGS